MKHEKLKKWVSVAMLSALAYIMTFLSRFLPPVILFLKYDPKDVIIAIGGFIFGPVAAAVIAIISSFIEMFSVSETGWIGFLMNILSSVAFASVAAFIYKRKKNFGRAVIGIIVGSVAMTVSMVLWNWLVTPIYMDVSRDYVVSLLMPVFVPFNILKAILNASFTIILYKPVINSLRRAKLVKISESAETYSPKKSVIISVCALVTAAVTVVLMILLKK